MSGKLLLLFVIPLLGFAVVQTVTADASVLPPEATVAPMTVDAVHSSIIFKVRHMDLASFYGAFKQVSGEVDLDDANPNGGSVMIEIDAASIDTRNKDRDEHMKNQEFLSVKEFPTITFKSKTVAKKGKEWEVAGDMTMHGVTKPLTVAIKQTGSINDPKFGKKNGYESEFTIKRSDFGVGSPEKKGLGDEIQVMMALETAAKK